MCICVYIYLYSWTSDKRGLNGPGQLIRWCLFNKHRPPFLSPGFASSDSINMESKTVFSHSHLQIPNCGLKVLISIPSCLYPLIQRANCKGVKSCMWIFDLEGSAPLTPEVIQGPWYMFLCILCAYIHVYVYTYIHVYTYRPSWVWLNGATKEKFISNTYVKLSTFIKNLCIYYYIVSFLRYEVDWADTIISPDRWEIKLPVHCAGLNRNYTPGLMTYPLSPCT